MYTLSSLDVATHSSTENIFCISLRSQSCTQSSECPMPGAVHTPTDLVETPPGCARSLSDSTLLPRFREHGTVAVAALQMQDPRVAVMVVRMTTGLNHVHDAKSLSHVLSWYQCDGSKDQRHCSILTSNRNESIYAAALPVDFSVVDRPCTASGCPQSTPLLLAVCLQQHVDVS